MARFIRDEKRTYPFMWVAIGGVFAASAGWAVYAELVTRVPWQKHQQAFFDMELEQSKQSLERSDHEWKEQIVPSLKDKLARKEVLAESMKNGAYADSRAKLNELNRRFAEAESEKTFGSSDLDEAYYHRNLHEYERDAAAVKVREIFHEVFASTTPAEGQKRADAIYADPPKPAQAAGETDKIHHLTSEIARMKAHIVKLDEAMRAPPAAATPTGDAEPGVKKWFELLAGRVRTVLAASKEAEENVVQSLEIEVKHQRRVDDALAKMNAIDGPLDPAASEKDATKRADARKAACAAHPDTRNCIQWLALDPVDLEIKALDVEVAKNRRSLTDAELRSDKATERANPKFTADNLIKSLVGPFQIQQVVMNWIEYDRDVDREQVDRCQTCHMGADSGTYQSASIPKQFRTHPHRSTLFTAHPIESFGCTSCHQGQGRATDMLSHSGWHLEEHHGKERWHFAGDHYWDDPLLPIGELTKVIIDERNDSFEVKIGRGKWETVKIDHRSPAERDKGKAESADYPEETELFAQVQEKLAKVVDAAGDVKAKWHAVVRRLDNRVQIGLEQNNPSEVITAKEVPAFGVKFAKRELAEVLGFEGEEITSKASIQTAMRPPSIPVRADSMPTWDDKTGLYHPPRGAQGLQIPDGMRNRFIEGLPEVESGCLRCHTSDVDLKQRASKAKFVADKLDYERAEAFRKADPEGYKKAHDGIEELPPVRVDPASVANPVPTFSEGRALFKKLNCTGCHILDGFAWDRNAGPALDNVSAKVSPEWLLSWIRYPRGFRAKTRMPNLWPRPLDPGSKRPYAEGSPEYLQWETQMREQTTAVASYLIERSDNPSQRAGAPNDAQPLKKEIQGYADVAGSSAEKGKIVFESYGCQGCHARTDSDKDGEKLPEPWRSRERDIAPSLSNMAGKTTADWIAYWVEDPARYWHGTKMPNLRLTREEAASVGKYVASLKEAPLEPIAVDKADVAAVTDPAKRAEKVACSAVGGAMLTRVECGERTIGYYGCFGCHQISGYEMSAPIAPELGAFAKKDVTTLDFGYAIADHHLHTTETFATLKLDSPRIYRRDRIELKMGDYDLSPREIRSLVVFLKGLVASKPKTAFKPQEHPEYAAALEGRQIVEDYNCRGCHVIEDHGADIDGYRTAQLAGDPQARAPYLDGEGQRVQPEWLFAFLREPGKHGIRPWLHPEWAYGEGAVPEDKLALRMPTFNFSNDQVTAIVRYFASWDGQEYPYQAVKANELAETQKAYTLTHMMAGDAANCLSCHYQGEFPKERGLSELSKLAPNFNMVARRLRPEWVKNWLLKPQNFLPYTKMTAFWATKDRNKDQRWPSESDPFISGAQNWSHIPGYPVVTAEQQVEMVRDFLFSLPADAKFPATLEEVAESPLVKKRSLEQAAAAATDKGKDDKGKDKDKGKDTKPPVKKTGRIDGPAHL